MKYPLLARKSIKVDYRSLAHMTSDLMWLKSFLAELGVPFLSHMLLCDSLNAVLLSYYHNLHAHTKHIELDIQFVREFNAVNKI